jgi:hypothetical protein
LAQRGQLFGEVNLDRPPDRIDPKLVELRAKWTSSESANCDKGAAQSCTWVSRWLMREGADATQLEGAKAKERRALAAECDRGYAFACFWQEATPTNTVSTKTAALAKHACGLGYLSACELTDDDTDGITACASTGRWCDLVADGRACARVGPGGCEAQRQRHADHRQPADLVTRDALEHGCQFREAGACLLLLEAYKRHAEPEPFAGRKQQLIDYFCMPENTKFDGATCDKARAP